MTDTTTNDGSESDDGEARGVQIDPLQVFSELLALTPDAPIFARLKSTHERRGENFLQLYTTFGLGLQACNEASTWLHWMAGLCTRSSLASLIERADINIARALEAILASDHATCNDIGRDLMEIEVLLRDFVRSPAQLEKWASSAREGRGDAFGFGKVLDRLRAAKGLSDQLVLPDQWEYRAHSASLHPTPAGRQRAAWDVADDPTVQLEHDLGDVLVHIGRIITALLDLAETTDWFPLEEGLGQAPPLDAMNAVHDVLMLRAAELAEWFRQATNSDIPLRKPFVRKSDPFRRSTST